MFFYCALYINISQTCTLWMMQMQDEEMAGGKQAVNSAAMHDWSVVCAANVRNVFTWTAWLFELACFCVWLEYEWNMCLPDLLQGFFTHSQTCFCSRLYFLFHLTSNTLIMTIIYLIYPTGFQLSFHTYFSETQPPVYSVDQNSAITGKESSRAHWRTCTETFTLMLLHYFKNICIYR